MPTSCLFSCILRLITSLLELPTENDCDNQKAYMLCLLYTNFECSGTKFMVGLITPLVGNKTTPSKIVILIGIEFLV